MSLTRASALLPGRRADTPSIASHLPHQQPLRHVATRSCACFDAPVPAPLLLCLLQVGESDWLLVIAQDKASLADPQGKKRSAERGGGNSSTRVTPASQDPTEMDGALRDVKRASPRKAKAGVDAGVGPDGRPRVANPHASPPSGVLILGWHASVGTLLRSLNARMAHGSSVYILSEMPLEIGRASCRERV